MAGKFCVSLSYAKDNCDKATVAFVVANAALGSEKETMVFLVTEGVRLSQRGYADDIHEEGFAPLKELMDKFAAAGGKIYVCSPCFKRRQARREQPGCRSCGCWRRKTRRIPVGRESVRVVLSREGSHVRGSSTSASPRCRV